MTASPLLVLVPDTMQEPAPVVPGAEFLRYAAAAPITREDADVLVVWGNPSEHIRDAAGRMPRLRLVQALSAGTDVVETAGFAPGVVICSAAGLHDRPVAEHTLALVLAAARSLHVAAQAKAEQRWAGEIGGMQQEPSPGRFTTLRGARVLLWGFGGIARTLAPHLLALGASVTGVARSARTVDGIRVIAAEDLGTELPHTDVLIDILPATPATRHLVDAEVLGQLPHHAWLVNVGRGATVDEHALVRALRAGRLGGAALDVFDTEPLPPESPLWDEPNVIITPHAAGGRPLGSAALVEHNVRALLEGDPLRNRVV
ncbi:phosphoglycerate dehydrogenase [Salinibacterium sp. dk2585]|uniref:NAD(P)-dependent oxidoreductase n=1 Tax=unclassified Salinibacterium TaxID=2632331 RepID=UPI0011C2553E|nr:MULTISPECIES: NAD(P)-dependent oxidoreductase [unclassified Salinibacterium]QEE61957.1 phosphoglycerate dehydrogenase [Salinibacterium sp. dk2585]TXK54488.1 phosphoglycerate dehydrogenase [Salinibacterium sp. dk5596]